MTQTALALHNITKRFGALLANDDISLSIQSGEVLALLGENGAGKSTLVSILFGHYVADSGNIEVRGKPLKGGDPKAALAAGIGIVHQHFALADNLSVIDNVMLGLEPLTSLASKTVAAKRMATVTMSQFGLEIDLEARVGSLSIGQKQRVEILKALVRGARILILDEPTAVLTPAESESLFATLATLVAEGLSVIFISHKLDEVMRISHRVAVLRHGRLVAQCDTAQTHVAQLASWMIGHELARPARRAGRALADATSSCELIGVNAQLDARERLRGVNLSLRSGRLTGVAGVSGNGQLAMAQLLHGQLAVESGQLKLPAGARADNIAQFVARVPEDRRHQGAIGELSLWENAVSERLRSHFSRWGFIRERAAKAHAKALIGAFDVRGAALDAPIKDLSGGNMQRLILGRALTAVGDDAPPQVIVAHQPTWGLDVNAVGAIHSRLLAARDAGAAVLLISDDLDEILGLADDLAVMHEGQLTPQKPVADWSRESIGLAMAGSP